MAVLTWLQIGSTMLCINLPVPSCSNPAISQMPKNNLLPFGPANLAFVALLLALSQIHHVAHAQAPIPSWTNVDGKVIKAEFVRLGRQDDVVIRKDGKEFSVPLSTLTKESRIQAVRLYRDRITNKDQEAEKENLTLSRQLVIRWYGLKTASKEMSKRIDQLKEIKGADPKKIQLEIEKLEDQITKIDSETRLIRTKLAAVLLRIQVSGLAPELRTRVDKIAGQMTTSNVQRAETLHSIARLLLVSD